MSVFENLTSVTARRAPLAWVLLMSGISACSVASGSAAGRLARIERSPQYRGGVFHNGEPTRLAVKDMGPWEMVKRWAGGEEVRVPTGPLPVEARATTDFDPPPASGLRLTWMGHSSLLVEIDGYRVLTDPVFSSRASPVGFAGPKRFFAPPLPIAALPRLDAVVISHDHYDHLDAATIRELAKRDVPFVAPLGVGGHLERWGIAPERIRELDWWEATAVGELSLVATPARHFSGRGVGDRNRTLWASFVIAGREHRVFFGGDGGMFPGFAEIGRRYGPFDVTLIESGAYNALWADVHIGPEQAVRAHQMLGGELMIPIHWGTFNLAFHAWTEPAERLLVAARGAGVRLAIPRPGVLVEPSSPPELARWWPELPWQTAEQAPIVSSGNPPHAVEPPAAEMAGTAE